MTIVISSLGGGKAGLDSYEVYVEVETEAGRTPLSKAEWSAQWEDARAQKAAAQEAATEAEASAALSEAARDAAFTNAEVFDDTVAGLAGTSVGEKFQVVTAETANLYRHDAGPVATLLATYPTKAAVEAAEALAERQVTDLRAEDPAAFGGRFHYKQNYASALADADGNMLLGVDERGNPMLGKSGTFPGKLSGYAADISFAYVDEEGHMIMAADGCGQPVHPGRTAFHYGDSIDEITITDFDGTPALRTDSEGRIASEIDGLGTAWLPYISGGQLRAIGNEDLRIAPLGDWTVEAYWPLRGDRVRAIIDQPGLLDKTTVTGRIGGAGNYLIPDAANVLHVIIGHGQSLMTGADSNVDFVDVENRWPDDALMMTCWEDTDVRLGLRANSGTSTASTLDADVLIGFEALRSVISSDGRGNTPLETMIQVLVQQAREYGVQFRCAGVNIAKAGSSYASLKKGQLAHTNMVNAITRLVEVAGYEGWKVVIDAVVLKHGEGDRNNTTYYDDIVEWQGDINDDLTAITGQSADIPLIFHQPSSHPVDTPYSTLAMLEAHNAAVPIYLAGADYPHSAEFFEDFTHFTGPGYVAIGEQLATAFMDLKWSSVGPQVIQITGAVRVGDTVTLTLDAPGGGLYFDTTTVTERDAKGFVFEDDTGAIAIDTVTITDDGASTGEATITLDLASTPSGTGERVLYAISPQSGGSPTLELVPRGNVRNSRRWAVHQIFDL